MGGLKLDGRGLLASFWVEVLIHLGSLLVSC
jgi:hypothetical protein